MGHFADGMAKVQKDGKWGFINTKGKLVIDYQYSNANYFDKGKAMVWLGNERFYINKQGKRVP